MDQYGKVQRIVYETLAEPPEGYRVGKIYGATILVLVAVNIVVGVLETIPSLSKYAKFFYYFELASVLIFTVEYVLMLWSCVADPQFGSRGAVCGRVRAATRPLAVVDILAILPFYLSSFVQVDLRFVRVLRLFRIFRLFRSGRMAESFRILTAVVLNKRAQLTLGLLIFVLVVLLVSSMMYIIEQGQPDTKFVSILVSMWWGIITITTIGYGDMVPSSALGKAFASLAGLMGICVFAIPVGIIGDGFLQQSDPMPKSNGGDGLLATHSLTMSGAGLTAPCTTPQSVDACGRSCEVERSSPPSTLIAEETREPASRAGPESKRAPVGDEVISLRSYGKMQRVVYETLVEPPEGYRAGQIYGSAILAFISVSIVVCTIETVPSLATYFQAFYYFELVSVVIFTTEYVLMLWSCVADPQFGSRGPVCGRVRAATRPLAVVDILAILPFYLSSFVQVDLRFVRVLRLFRLFRLFRSGKMAKSANVMWDVILDNREQLTLGLLVHVFVVLLVSSVMFIIEQNQPNTKFTSIPASMWWAVVTITTIGYGDMVPTSVVGKVFASFVSFLGICVLAIPVGIIGNGFATHGAPAAESNAGGWTVPRVPPRDGSDFCGSANDCPPAT